MSSKRKSPPTKLTPDELSNDHYQHISATRPPPDGCQIERNFRHQQSHAIPTIPEVEENNLNLYALAEEDEEDDDDQDELGDQDFDDLDDLDEMTSSPVLPNSPNNNEADPESDGVLNESTEGRTSLNSSARPHHHRKQRLLQSVSSYAVAGQLGSTVDSESDSDPGCYSGSESGLVIDISQNQCALENNSDNHNSSNNLETVPTATNYDSSRSAPVSVAHNKRSMDDVLKKLTSKMHSSTSLNDSLQNSNAPDCKASGTAPSDRSQSSSNRIKYVSRPRFKHSGKQTRLANGKRFECWQLNRISMF